ncbi:class I SAM-dependent methyltransferase [soil metagenome]
MKTTFVAALAAAAVMAGAAAAQTTAPASVPAYVTAAVSDAGRPAADTARDDLRLPAEMLAFADVHPGETIGEILPGGGYFTRIFSKAVGPEGHVYAIINTRNPERPTPPAIGIAADPAYGNVTVVEGPLGAFALPQPVDLVWTSDNYHDIPDANRGAVNAAAFNALKSGGIYIVLDHSAVPGSGPANTLHRMDEAVARAQIEAAGFVFVEASEALRRPADDRTLPVFDANTRGHTDQFILKYRKP